MGKLLGIVYCFDSANKEIRALINSGLFAEFMASSTPLLRMFCKNIQFYLILRKILKGTDKNGGNQIFLYEKTEGSSEENRVFVRNAIIVPIKSASQKLMGFISVKFY